MRKISPAELAASTSEPRLFRAPGLTRATYIVDDPGLHKRLLIKANYLRVGSALAIIIGQPLAFSLLPQLYEQTVWFLAYVLMVVLLWSGAAVLLLRGDLRGLAENQGSLPAGEVSRPWITTSLVVSLLLALTAALLLLDGDYIAVCLFSLTCALLLAIRCNKVLRMGRFSATVMPAEQDGLTP